MFIRPFYILLHLSSQWLNRWVPPLEYDQCLVISKDLRDFFNGSEFDESDHGEWQKLIEYVQTSQNQSFEGIKKILVRITFEVELIKYILSHLNAVKKNNANYILFCDSSYPNLLRNISDPPLGLTIIGNVDNLCDPAISIIGSRRATHRVASACKSLASKLVEKDVVVVSGGAYGCDIAAHLGVLAGSAVSAKTIVVIAGGLETLYPKGNMSTFREIVKREGTILTEKHWFAQTRKYDFPVRNRIISGMSMVTVVMQADMKSGAMITAKLALDQGRDVAVFYQEEGFVGYEGSLQLIDDGALCFANLDGFVNTVSL